MGQFTCYNGNIKGKYVWGGINMRGENLLAYMDCLKNCYRELYLWHEAQLRDGIVIPGYAEYDKRMFGFVNAVYDSGLLLSNYREIIAFCNPENKDLDLLIADAELPLLRAILTYYIREEHYHAGLWGKAVYKKSFLRILERLRECGACGLLTVPKTLGKINAAVGNKRNVFFFQKRALNVYAAESKGAAQLAKARNYAETGNCLRAWV